VFYEQGISWAEKSLAERPTSEGYRILGMNISLLCTVRRSYGFSNFRLIESNAEKALEQDPQNLAAFYLIAAKRITAPWPVGDIRSGFVILEKITGQNLKDMEKEDVFYLYMMMEVACLKLKRNQEARIWHEKAVSLYPVDAVIDILLKRNG
jgi:tetratricopeptide (TPR) repeat protein